GTRAIASSPTRWKKPSTPWCATAAWQSSTPPTVCATSCRGSIRTFNSRRCGMHRRSLLLLGLLGASAPLLGAGQDPVESVMWDYFHQQILAGQPIVHDPRVVLEAPPFAEDSRQVSIQVDARAYAGQDRQSAV